MNQQLLAAATAALHAIEEATDAMHYEHGEPVTALECWEIERIYCVLVSVMPDLRAAVAANKGH